MAERVLIIANRGEVALRVKIGLVIGHLVILHAADDPASGNLADDVVELPEARP